jgi:hypothetical protein
MSKREREREREFVFFVFFSCISVTLFWSFNKLQQEPPLIPKKKKIRWMWRRGVWDS